MQISSHRMAFSPAGPRFRQRVRRDSKEAARRIFAASRPLRGTLAETYLRSRGLTLPLRFPALRFHPACYYRADDHAPLETWPALIAAVTDLSGNVTGVLRTWLAPDGSAKAPIANPHRAMVPGRRHHSFKGPLLVRLPSERADRVVMQASENLHKTCPEHTQQRTFPHCP